MKPAQNKCLHPDCGKLKPREHFSCVAHWVVLPKEIRDRIWAGYRYDAAEWMKASDDAVRYWKDPTSYELTKPFGTQNPIGKVQGIE